MRVLVCFDEVGALSSAEAGRAVAAGWAGAQTAVVPVGEAGAGFVRASADGLGVPLRSDVDAGRVVLRADGERVAAVGVPGPGLGSGPIPYGATSQPLGRALRDAVGDRPGTVWLDLAGDDVHDGGAGLLAALGARADVDLGAGVEGLRGLTELDLAAARQVVAGVELVGVVPRDHLATPLLGLRGITSVRGRAAGDDPARLLAADAALERLADLAGPGLGAQPGAGACGGVGLAVLALDGRLATGPGLALDGVDGPVDLVVTGCSVFDFHARGGGVVQAAAELAGRLLCPCVVLAGEVLIGGREMRTMGVEAAYAVRTSTADAPTGGDVTADELAALAVRVARSWTW